MGSSRRRRASKPSRSGIIALVPNRDGPDLHRDKLGLADDADRRALGELRVVAPIALMIGLATWIIGAGPLALGLAIPVILVFVQWRAAFIRRKVRREYRHRAQRSP
jgi:hypothetical protein